LKAKTREIPNEAIAAEIFISEKTVEFYLNNIYKKIGVRMRVKTGFGRYRKGNGQKLGKFLARL